MGMAPLSKRERQVLEAVIRLYVESAEPAGSRTVARRFGLDVSPATVRNTMSDLEEKGFLYHPHTSAGRIPTDLAYRYYVDALMPSVRLTAPERKRLRRELWEGEGGALERLIGQSTMVLGLLTGELGLAIAPRLEETVLESLELLSVASDKVLLVLKLRNGMVRTVYVDLSGSFPPETLLSVNVVLNERLGGQTLSEIRATLPERLRDSSAGEATELLNIFLQAADDLLDFAETSEDDLHLGRTSVLANQPEFSSGSRLRSLIELTERRDLLTGVLADRSHEDASLKITIGAEHAHPELAPFTLVTSRYHVGGLSGVLGVIGPTRMPYEKVAAIVESTSALISELATPASSRARPTETT